MNNIYDKVLKLSQQPQPLPRNLKGTVTKLSNLARSINIDSEDSRVKKKYKEVESIIVNLVFEWPKPRFMPSLYD